MIITKQALQKRIWELESDNQQYRIALQLALLDSEASRRERDQARRELILLQESLLDEFNDGFDS
ncbi:MAG: hypothetical protein ACFFCM_18960 [Promethearchaeota archaeon]